MKTKGRENQREKAKSLKLAMGRTSTAPSNARVTSAAAVSASAPVSSSSFTRSEPPWFAKARARAAPAGPDAPEDSLVVA